MIDPLPLGVCNQSTCLDVVWTNTAVCMKHVQQMETALRKIADRPCECHPDRTCSACVASDALRETP